MKTVMISCMKDFACLAGACPDTCCRDWEIALDEQTLARYEAMPGELGEQIRAEIRDDDGACFQLRGGYCPFLNEDGLCRIQLAHGAEALSRNCDYFPRFVEEYGATREVTFSPACPEAARRLLHAEILELDTQEDGIPVTEPNELDPALYLGLRALRSRMLRLVMEPRPLDERLAELMALAEAAQKQLDKGKPEKLLQLPERKRIKAFQPDEGELVQFYAGLTILRPDWPEMLRREPAAYTQQAETAAARYLYHHLFRYALKAVNDYSLLPRVRAGVWGAVLIRRLISAGVDPVTAVYRYSREIEHNEENFARVMGR